MCMAQQHSARFACRLHAVTRGLASDRPLVLLLHGFPESWYSWRHQMQVMHGWGLGLSMPESWRAAGA